MENKNAIIFAIVAIVLGLIIVGVAIYYYFFLLKEPTQQVLSESLFTNSDGKYSFKYPSVWQAAINQYNKNNSLFGPGANSGSGAGGVEVFDGTSIDDFLKGVDATYSDKVDITVSGVKGIYTHYNGFPLSGVQSVLFKDNKIYNIYINSEDAEQIRLFNQLLLSFKFL